MNEIIFIFLHFEWREGIEENVIPRIKRNKHTNLMFYDVRI